MSEAEGTWIVVCSFGGTAYLGKVSNEYRGELEDIDDDGPPFVVLNEARELEKYAQLARSGVQRVQTLGPIHGAHGAVDGFSLYPVSWYFPKEEDVLQMVAPTRVEEEETEKRIRAAGAGLLLPEEDPRTIR